MSSAMRRLIVIAALILWIAGCASEREQNLRRFGTMHQDLRKDAPETPQKWEMNPGAK